MGHDIAPVLVTGAAGYLGGHVLAKLQERHIPCVATSHSGTIGLECDLTDSRAVRALLDLAKPSAIIHCAAVVPKSMAAYDDTQAANASIAMVRSISVSAACPVVFASSMTVYARATEFPVREDGLQPPDSGYAHGKWQAEQVLFGRNFQGDVALRLPGLFGLPRRSGLLYNAAKSLLVHGEFSVSSCAEMWAAMAVCDAAEYLVRAAVSISGCPPQAVNAGYAGSFSIPAAVAQIAALCGVDWRLPSAPVKEFSMCLQRLEARYGMLSATFQQRLGELVDVVRQDLAGERIGECYAS